MLDVYQRPDDPQYPHVCLDELHTQLVQETRTPLPVKPGQPARYDDEDERNGTAHVFLFTEPLQNVRWTSVPAQPTRHDWAQQIKDLVDVRYPDAEKVVLVMDHLNTHTPGALDEAFAPAEAKRLADKLEIHYTPKQGRWLISAEIELSVLTTQCLDRRIPAIETRRGEVTAWHQRRNALGGRVDWRFTTADARIKLKRLYPSIVA